MKRIMILLVGMVAVMILGVVPVFGSQTVGTPLYTDPGVDARIRSAPLPEGYSFGRALPPSIDLEVEWQPIGDPDFYRGITGIFIDPDGIRVVDIHPQIMAGMRVWLSRDGGKNWRVERTSPGVFRIVEGPYRRRWQTFEGRFVGVEELGLCRERAKVILSPHHMGAAHFRTWPLEVENLIKTEFRGLYEQRGKMSSSGRTVFFAQEPSDVRTMVFVSLRALGAPMGRPQNIVRIFVTLDGGEEWIEINPPTPCQAPMTDGSFFVGGLAIKRVGNTLELFLGAKGDGRKMVQATFLCLSEFQEVLANK